MRWDIDPNIFRIGPLEFRWYFLFFGIWLVHWNLKHAALFKERGLPNAHCRALMPWMPLGMLIGSHLTHIIFYEPHSLLDPIRILSLTSGLSSHGGLLGGVVALLLFCRSRKVPFHVYADPALLAGCWMLPLVRLGNLFNSTIYGRPTDLPWGVVFVRRGFTEARHPTQIYECLIGFAVVGLVAWIDRAYRGRLRSGTVFYLLIMLYCTGRFFIEYVKEYQVFSPNTPLTMGQVLSIPMILGSLGMLVRLYHEPARPEA